MNDTVINTIYLKFVTGRMAGESALGHVCFYRPLPDDMPDAISSVANVNGFVSCTAVAKYLGIRPRCLVRAVIECNTRQEICVLNPCAEGMKLHGVEGHTPPPAFLLTPRPPDYRLFDEQAAQQLMNDLLMTCELLKCFTLRMTQFGILQLPRPFHHLTGVHKAISGHHPVSLKTIIFDVDDWHSEEIIAAITGNR